jgi:hypothetical protein
MPGFPSRAFFAFATTSYSLPASYRCKPDEQGQGLPLPVTYQCTQSQTDRRPYNQSKAFVTPHYCNGPSLIASTDAATRAQSEWSGSLPIISSSIATTGADFSKPCVSMTAHAFSRTSRSLIIKQGYASAADPGKLSAHRNELL